MLRQKDYQHQDGDRGAAQHLSMARLRKVDSSSSAVLEVMMNVWYLLSLFDQVVIMLVRRRALSVQVPTMSYD